MGNSFGWMLRARRLSAPRRIEPEGNVPTTTLKRRHTHSCGDLVRRRIGPSQTHKRIAPAAVEWVEWEGTRSPTSSNPCDPPTQPRSPPHSAQSGSPSGGFAHAFARRGFGLRGAAPRGTGAGREVLHSRGVGSSSVDSPSHPASSVTALKVSVCLKGFWVVKGPLLLATHFPLLPHHNKTIHTTTTRSPRLDWPFIHQPWCSSPYIHVGGFGWPLERGSGVGGAADTLHHERYNRTQQQRRERNLPLWAESPVVRQHDWVPPCT